MKKNKEKKDDIRSFQVEVRPKTFFGFLLGGEIALVECKGSKNTNFILPPKWITKIEMKNASE